MLLFQLGIVAFSQVIKGTISDKNTKSAIDYASVYINGTFIGTYTDENGNFELDILKNPSMPISINAIGYYDPAGILWEGKMAMQRVGDRLPYEYVYSKL